MTSGKQLLKDNRETMGRQIILGDKWELRKAWPAIGNNFSDHIWETSGKQLDNKWRNLGNDRGTTPGKPHLGDNWETTSRKEAEDN